MNKPEVPAKLVKAIKKLMSEEWIAYMSYFHMWLSMKPEDNVRFYELFHKVWDDELGDHFQELAKWAIAHDIDVPSKQDEFEKLADKKFVKCALEFTKKQDIAYYLKKAIEGEKLAIESYREVLDLDETMQYPDLTPLLWHIYYDEVEHLDKLDTALIIAERPEINFCF